MLGSMYLDESHLLTNITCIKINKFNKVARSDIGKQISECIFDADCSSSVIERKNWFGLNINCPAETLYSKTAIPIKKKWTITAIYSVNFNTYFIALNSHFVAKYND